MINAIIYIGIFEPTFKPLFKKLALITTAKSPSSDDKEDILELLHILSKQQLQ